MFPVMFHVESRAIPAGCYRGGQPGSVSEQAGPCCQDSPRQQVTAAPAPTPFLHATLAELGNIACQFESQACRLTDFNDRVLGPEPSAVGDVGKAGDGNVVSACIDVVNRLKRAQAVIDAQLQRIGQLA